MPEAVSPFEALIRLRELGGPVVIWIFICCVVMWMLVLERLWFFTLVLPKLARRLRETWNERKEHHSWAAHQIRRAMISRMNASMNANQLLLQVLVPMAPLLGLLGTVSGMLNVFDSMAASGSADARSMATGVSEAMICTLTGLAVSISGLYPVFYFRRRVRRETELLADRFQY
jgi:biopolymer transport protein ExbB